MYFDALFNVFFDEYGLIKTSKSDPLTAKKNLDFMCFLRLENMRFHCYLQHILKVRILICSQRGA